MYARGVECVILPRKSKLLLFGGVAILRVPKLIREASGLVGITAIRRAVAYLIWIVIVL